MMRARLIVLLLLHAGLCSLVSAAQLPACLSQLELTGTWTPQESTTGPAWQCGKDRLSLTLPASASGTSIVTRNEPLPEGDWTIDVWAVEYGDFHGLEVNVVVGERGSSGGALEVKVPCSADRTDVVILDSEGDVLSYDGCICGAGPIQWIRIAYSPSRKRVAAFINGQPVPCRDKEIAVPRSPVRLSAGRQSTSQKENAVEIASFQVTPGAKLSSPDIPGLAFRGWKSAPKADMLRSIPDLSNRLQSLRQSSDVDACGRAHVLAAMLLSEQASSGRLSPDSWSKVAAFVQENSKQNPAAVLELLPIATACASPNQRSEVTAWLKPFQELKLYAWKDIGLSPSLLDYTLLQPGDAIRVAAGLSYAFPLPLMQRWSGELADTSPELGLELLSGFLGEQGWKPDVAAWLLPELHAVSPNYSRLAVDYIAALGMCAGLQRGEPDRTWSFAAYRLAAVDIPSAVKLWGRIGDPQVKAETIEYIAAELSEGSNSALDQNVETFLKQAVSEWKPAKPSDSPVAQMMRLAHWYESKGKHEDAVELMSQAAQKASTHPDAQFRDTLEIARLAGEMGHPDGDMWWSKAQDLAVARDKARTEPDSGAGSIYISATSFVVRHLAAENRIDEALKLTQALDPELFPQNRAMCMSAVVQRVAYDDLPRALELLGQMDKCTARDALTAKLAANMATKDVGAALAMIQELPSRARMDATFGIGEVVPPSKSEPIMDALRAAIASAKKPDQPRKWLAGGPDTLAIQMSGLPLQTVLALEPEFASSQSYYALQLLASVANAVGLREDPLWMCYFGTGWEQGKSIPWGTDRLRYSVPQAKS